MTDGRKLRMICGVYGIDGDGGLIGPSVQGKAVIAVVHQVPVGLGGSKDTCIDFHILRLPCPAQIGPSPFAGNFCEIDEAEPPRHGLVRNHEGKIFGKAVKDGSFPVEVGIPRLFGLVQVIGHGTAQLLGRDSGVEDAVRGTVGWVRSGSTGSPFGLGFYKISQVFGRHLSADCLISFLVIQQEGL